MITDLKGLWMEAFGDPAPFVDGFFRTGYDPDRCRVLYENGKLAAALYWFDCQWDGRKLAYIYAVATKQELRGRGLCRRLMEQTHRHLQALGYAGAVLVPGEASLFSFYEAMGYEICSTVGEFTCRAAAPLALRRVDAGEYARLRKSLLPAGGVVQEGAVLNFLATYASFWAGENCLLAASVQENTVYVQEYLGSADLAPAVTGALGGEKGVFRTPGTDRPFAMYHALHSSAAPTYFGLALD